MKSRKKLLLLLASGVVVCGLVSLGLFTRDRFLENRCLQQIESDDEAKPGMFSPDFLERTGEATLYGVVFVDGTREPFSLTVELPVLRKLLQGP